MSNPSDSRAPFKTKAPRQRSQRNIRLIQPFDAEGKNAEVCITVTRGGKAEEFFYWIDKIPSDWGMAFLVEKQGDGSEENPEYHVLLDSGGSSCDCKGFSRWDHCKHVEGILALKAAGRI